MSKFTIFSQTCCKSSLPLWLLRTRTENLLTPRRCQSSVACCATTARPCTGLYQGWVTEVRATHCSRDQTIVHKQISFFKTRMLCCSSRSLTQLCGRARAFVILEPAVSADGVCAKQNWSAFDSATDDKSNSRLWRRCCETSASPAFLSNERTASVRS